MMAQCPKTLTKLIAAQTQPNPHEECSQEFRHNAPGRPQHIEAVPDNDDADLEACLSLV